MRVRFAPSPTGNLHLGTLRTALFNWLLAKNKKGTVVLRIEDTDLNRSEASYEGSILEGMAWLGLTVDEGPTQGGEYGPYRQSEKIQAGTYQKYVQQLLDSGHAYYCFCTTEELDAERVEAKEKGIPYVYSRKALQLSEAEVQEKLSQNQAYTIRFKMPEQAEIKFNDLIRGEISFETKLIGDFVMMKSDGSPSYNFAVVVDDMEMAISHVIRGEDHISNTPKQLSVFKALGADVPAFAHMPMILGADKSKLSKRHGATNVIDYKHQGFLPEAMFNYLSLLGWSPPDEREIMSIDEIQSLFSLDRMSKAGAVFDLTKLKWMNGQYIRKYSPEMLLDSLQPFISQDNKTLLSALSSDKQVAVINAIQDNLETLADVNDYLLPFVMSEETFLQNLSEMTFNETDLQVLTLLNDACEQLSEESLDTYQAIMDNIFEKTGLGKGKVLKPIRRAVSGLGSGPQLIDILWVFGQDKVQARLEKALAK